MGLIQDTDRFVQYRYRVSEFIIMVGGENIKLEPMQIVGMTISEDFETDIFPVFKVQITIEPEVYIKMVKNKDKVKFKVRVQKYSTDQSTGKKSLYTDYINDIFTVFLDDTDSNYDEKLTKQKRKTDGIGDRDVSMHLLNEKIDLFLFKEEYVVNIKKRINFIPKSINMITTIAYIMTESGISGALVSPLDNRKTYSPLMLPALNTFKLLQYLDYNFGFYKNGALIYFGLDRPYILNYKKGCTAWSGGEWKETVFIILESSNEHNKMASAIIRGGEQKYYINAQRKDVNATNASISNNAIGGSDAYVINADQQSVNTVASGAKTRGGAAQTRVINDTQNEFIGQTFAAQQAASSTIITVSVTNVDLSAFTPNKDTSFIFEDSVANSQYKGHYHLANGYYKFIKEGEDFTVEVTNTYKIAN